MRSLRLALAATAVAGVVLPLTAHAAPPQPPATCHWVKYEIAAWSSDTPVFGGQSVDGYRLECYY